MCATPLPSAAATWGPTARYLFSRQGQIYFARAEEEALLEAALEAGAEDVEVGDDGSAVVVTAFEDFMAVKEALIEAGLQPDGAEVSMVAAVTVPLDREASEKVMAMVEALEDLDDVQNVYTNAEYDESAYDA